MRKRARWYHPSSTEPRPVSAISSITTSVLAKWAEKGQTKTKLWRCSDAARATIRFGGTRRERELGGASCVLCQGIIGVQDSALDWIADRILASRCHAG